MGRRENKLSVEKGQERNDCLGTYLNSMIVAWEDWLPALPTKVTDLRKKGLLAGLYPAKYNPRVQAQKYLNVLLSLAASGRASAPLEGLFDTPFPAPETQTVLSSRPHSCSVAFPIFNPLQPHPGQKHY